MTALSSRTSKTRPSAAVLWGALAIVYVVWGSTYLGIRVTLDDMPALLTAGVRFLVAGAIAAMFLTARHGLSVLRVSPAELRGSAIVGVLLLGGGNGGVVLGERSIPSGVAALLVAMVPLWVVVLRRLSGDRPRGLTWCGVLLGLVGLSVLVLPGSGGVGDLTGVVFVVCASLCWSIGSFSSQHMSMPANPFVATVWEMLSGGLVLTVVALVRGERAGPLGDYQPESLLALGYLVVFGSLVAYTAYSWLLENAELSLVSTYAYVNPVVAVLLGALLLDESISARILLGGAIVVGGVALVVTAERHRPRPDDSPAEGQLRPEPLARTD